MGRSLRMSCVGARGCISIASDVHAVGQMTATSFIIDIILSSITNALARDNMLQVIVFVVLFGIHPARSDASGSAELMAVSALR